MLNFDYNILSVRELTVDTLNLVRDGNMILKSNTAIRLNSAFTSLVLNNDSIHLVSDEVAINDTNMVQFLNDYYNTTFVTNVNINGEQQSIIDGTLNIPIPTDYVKISDDGVVEISNTTIDNNGITTDRLQLESLQITKSGIDEGDNPQFNLNINNINAQSIKVQDKPVALHEDVLEMYDEIQDILQFDNAPSQGSDKLLKSGVVYTAFSDVYDALQAQYVAVDSELNTTSENPVQNKLITNELLTKVNNDDFNNTVENLNTSITNVQTTLSQQIANEVTTREQETETLQTNIDIINTNIENINTDIEAINTDIIDIRYDISQINNDITETQQQIAAESAARVKAINEIIESNNQQLIVNNVALDSNKLYVYININITSDFTVTECKLIVDTTNDISSINEETVKIEDYSSEAIALSNNNKQILVKEIDLINSQDFIYIRIYSKIQKGSNICEIYSPLYITSKAELNVYTDYCLPVWHYE